MPTLQQIKDSVITNTGRGDRAAMIESYVKYAVRHAHSLAHFTNDLKKVDLQNIAGAAAKIGTVNYPADCKEFYAIRPVSGAVIATTSVGRPIKMTKISGAQLVDHEIAGTVVNTFHALGQTIEYNCEVAVSTFRCIYFAYPDISTLGKSTWITEQYSEELEMLVKARLFTALGDRERARQLNDDWKIAAKDIVNDNETEAIG